MVISCPFPEHPDKNPSFSINLETGQWICFSRCGGGSWVELIARLNTDPEWAEAEVEGTPHTVVELAKLDYLLDRGFSLSTLDEWGIYWDEEAQAIGIPICSALTGRQLGVIYRNLNPGPNHPKYVTPSGLEKSEHLFGLHKVPPAADEVVLVEGPLDAIWLHAAGLYGAAIMGSSLSEGQVRLLGQWGIKRVVLCFDNDLAGRKATDNAIPLLQGAGYWVFRACLPRGVKDIQEVPLAKVKSVLEKRELAVNGRGFAHHRYASMFGGSAVKTTNKFSVWKY